MASSNIKPTISRMWTRAQARYEAQPSVQPKLESRPRRAATTVAKPRTRTKATLAPAHTAKTRNLRSQATVLGVSHAASAVVVPRPSPAPAAPKCQERDKAQDAKPDLRAQRRAAIADLHDVITVDGACLRDMYKVIASDRRIKNFLTATSLYDYNANSWTGLPHASKGGVDLHSRFVEIFKAIIDGLGNANGTRDVVDTRDMKFRHRDDSAEVSTPDMAIRAAGPSFELPRGRDQGQTVAFSNVASVFNVKPEGDVTKEDVDHLAVYNRQLFFWQLNRLFTRSLLLTETHVRLVHCDWSGAYKTTPLNIHADPCTFVCLILGLSSVQERVLGLDTSVQWTVKRGKRVAGTICTVDALGKRVKYKLNMQDSCFVTMLVRGRSTVCWNVKDKDETSVLIKDAWRTESQVPEYTFLEQAKGLEGVVQMFAYEDGRARTKNFRPECFDFNSDDFYDRNMSRVTMARYGASLNQFTSQRQAISGLRDAVQGHLNLLKARVLHRDVSMDNILFGGEGAAIGNRGVLIDLDMAAVSKGPTATIITELPAGTHLYQSISALDTSRASLVTVAHDYLDDLESFFYVLCHLLYGYEGVGSPAQDAFTGTGLLAHWENLPNDDASTTKLSYITHYGPNLVKPPLFWSSACIKLCDDFRRYLFPLIEDKLKARVVDRDPNERKALLEELHDGLEKHYADIIALFDTALEDLQKPGGEGPRQAPIPPPPSPVPSIVSYTSTVSTRDKTTSSPSCRSSPSSAKRSSDDLEDVEVSTSKRQRSTT
ncbi:hypothetical protein D9611_005965 [Ephemerocybe angulata]|uniref:Fungal-type protein kinase domain-containing protein n=1 Tax=Ephemerocybe angulata TaxID=980116 RepID=A0A8H5CHM6_9AGAR|nr:hypothetical protein D9611_005965 [Tulosesus angulatus]